MNEREVNAITGRLSLRDPQRDSLALLARVTGTLKLAKEYDLPAALESVQSVAPSVLDFERAFPSLCFSLATGVGKTRLMGAFIAYLYRAHGLKHFFVLAPNLTIYEKLKADFTRNTPKYVFPGLGDVGDQLVLITGDDWQDGRGVRATDLYRDSALHVNVFNVAKINSEVRGGAAPRMKRLYEVIGDSYFDYLSKLDDLVLIMDESHRYRAQAGAKAIEGLKPILGLELTATPQTVQGTQVRPFKNVAFNYPLANAIRDGYVKEPAVATRSNFNARDYSDEALERLKLEDGMQLHEQTKAHLEAYAAEHDVRPVKPFVLVVAESTAHAESVKSLMESPEFCAGRYAGRVITVHSNQIGEIRDEQLQRLLNVEDPAEPTEVVIHVNKLGEGWDVTNLYTIIPLRAANSPNLVEQALGRGLRLPYGRKTGDEVVDRLTVVSHDKFQAIVDHAREPGSLVQVIKEVRIDEETARPIETVRAQPIFEMKLNGSSPMTQLAAKVAADPSIGFVWSELHTPHARDRLVQAVMERAPEEQGTLGLDGTVDEIKRAVEESLKVLADHTIPIPRITLRPKVEVRFDYAAFELDVRTIRNQPLEQSIYIQALQSGETALVATGIVADESRLENYVVRELAADSAISYERHAALLYDLAGQLLRHLRTYLPDEESVTNVLVTQGRALAAEVRRQLVEHRVEEDVEYEAVVHGDVHLPRPIAGTVHLNAALLDFRALVADKSQIRRMRFGGFKRCLFEDQRFQSDAERRFAVILENDADESLKWYKPALGDIRVWLRGGEAYNPDFVVETRDYRCLAEPKADNELLSALVKAKAAAAREWCKHASAWDAGAGGRPWRYLLVPDSAIVGNSTLDGLLAQFE